MSEKELDRIKLLERLSRKEVTQRYVAEKLNLSTRQVRRLLQAYSGEGTEAILSKKKGKPSNRQFPKSLKDKIIKIIFEQYPDFGPTLAHEKLKEIHHFSISLSFVRQLMIKHQLWIPKRQKQAAIHQRRERRPYLGELEQLDASIHDWFEERGPRCALLTFIDDATSQLMALRFVEVENMWNYFDVTQQYLEKYGRPREMYCDRHSVFIPRKEESAHGKGITQFRRAMDMLGIKVIYALSPQAKGRVERAYRTLQDRLVKELRLRGISTIEAANAFAEEFREDYNNRFAKLPKQPFDAHRTLEQSHDLDYIFSWHETRTLSKDLILQYHNKHYQIVPSDKYSHKMHGAGVKIVEGREGNVRIFYQQQELKYTIYEEQPYTPPANGLTEMNEEMKKWLNKKERNYRPNKDHPWRKFRI